MAETDDRNSGGSDSDRDDRDRDRMQGNQRNPGSSPGGQSDRQRGNPGSQPGQGSDPDDDEPGMGMPERKERQRNPEEGSPRTDRSTEDEENPAE
jgi:hypothetical protein